MQNIGSPDSGGPSSHADAITPDGSVVVGASGGRAFIWRQGSGIEDLQTLLAPPAGWTLTEARGISADGTIIVGNGSLGAWIATLPCLTTVPEVDNSLVATGAPTSTISWGGIPLCQRA